MDNNSEFLRGILNASEIVRGRAREADLERRESWNPFRVIRLVYVAYVLRRMADILRDYKLPYEAYSDDNPAMPYASEDDK